MVPVLLLKVLLVILSVTPPPGNINGGSGGSGKIRLPLVAAISTAVVLLKNALLLKLITIGVSEKLANRKHIGIFSSMQVLLVTIRLLAEILASMLKTTAPNAGSTDDDTKSLRVMLLTEKVFVPVVEFIVRPVKPAPLMIVDVAPAPTSDISPAVLSGGIADVSVYVPAEALMVSNVESPAGQAPKTLSLAAATSASPKVQLLEGVIL